ncbi:hypothetical protein SCLCIDRAFT_1207973 [Scleroderma citrinum Foug A]|uniref:Uncharacterized protein n=1 Tax=Scleroderma citrinum Foug A TaxID=1036808 RepID=A0A0C3AX21_9AGAM|nr:hypothetical protein SCLCIDRAFT_1207973 [Scleroderma citrinum Foug A]
MSASHMGKGVTVYSWPCANESMRRSRMVSANVKPWQPLKVQWYMRDGEAVVFAGQSNQCRRD